MPVRIRLATKGQIRKGRISIALLETYCVAWNAFVSNPIS